MMFTAATLLVLLAMSAVVFRAVRGPTVFDRTQAVNTAGTLATMPLTTLCGIVGALAISAFPLTSGFVSKSMVSQAAADAHVLWLWLALTAHRRAFSCMRAFARDHAIAVAALLGIGVLRHAALARAHAYDHARQRLAIPARRRCNGARRNRDGSRRVRKTRARLQRHTGGIGGMPLPASRTGWPACPHLAHGQHGPVGGDPARVLPAPLLPLSASATAGVQRYARLFTEDPVRPSRTP